MFEGSKNVRRGRLRSLARSRRRQQQRLDEQRSHQLLHRHPVERARARAVPRVRSHGLPARHDDARARRRPARRRQERAPPELREPAVRPGVPRACSRCSIRRAPLQLADHRLDGGPHGRHAATMSRSSSRPTTRPTTPASSSPATSTSPRRASWSRNGSARSRAAPAVPPIAPPAAHPHRGQETDDHRPACSCRGCISRGTRRRVFAPGDAAMDIAASLLTGGKNARLYRRLVYDLQIAQDVNAFQQSQGLGSVVRDHRHRAPGADAREDSGGHRRRDRQAARDARRMSAR